MQTIIERPTIQLENIPNKRKNQVFKRHIPAYQNKELTRQLIHFFESLGFEKDDSISIQLLHETLGYYFEGEITLNQLHQKSFREISMFVNSKTLGNIRKYIKTENENGFGVFFSVLGSRKEKEKQKVRFQMLDFDTGKQIEEAENEEQAIRIQSKMQSKGCFRETKIISPNNFQPHFKVVGYYTEQEIQKRKQEFLTTYKQELQIALIVETKNGFHIYFRIQDGEIEKFRDIQYALAKKFGGDLQVTDHARILRVPFYFHVKNPTEPFFVEVIQWGVQNVDGQYIRLRQDDLIRRYDLKTSDVYDMSKIEIKPISDVSKKKSNKSTIHLKKSIQEALDRNNVKYPKKMSHTDFILFLKTIPFDCFFENIEFQTENVNFPCLFHDDEHPSANIYTNEQGIKLYRCFSTHCDVHSWTVLDILMKMFDMSLLDTLTFLSNKLGIELVQSEYQQQVLQTLHQNLMWIKQNLECPNVQLSEKPLLYQFFTKDMRKILKEMVVQVLSYPINENCSIDGKPIFFISHRYLEKECKINKRNVHKYLDILILLGFFDKLSHHKVPTRVFKRYNKDVRAINYYTVNVFEEMSAGAEEMVNHLKAIRFKKQEISFDYLYASLGKEVAKRVYPNNHTKRLTQPKKEQPRQVNKVTDLLLAYAEGITSRRVQQKGYIKEQQLFESILTYIEEEHIAIPKYKIDSMLKTITVYLQSQGYKRTSLTKTVAKQLGLKKAQTKEKRIYLFMKK